MNTRPGQYPSIFGKNFANRNNGTIVQIGARTYDRYDLGAIGCPHTQSARTLDRVLKQLGVLSIEDLVEHFSPEDFVGIKGFRVTAFYALTCILRDAKVNLRSFYQSKVTVDTLATNTRKHKRSKKRAAA